MTGHFSVTGLSPPTRGSPLSRYRRRPEDGSIPAHAGEPIAATRKPDNSGVYPRPRGGAWLYYFLDFLGHGLSPPTRGSHRAESVAGRDVRSIPAHAGEPRNGP